jgi:hypothetical protein
VNFSGQLGWRTAIKKYRSERKGRRSFRTAIEFGTVAIIAAEKTGTAKSAVCATCSAGISVHNSDGREDMLLPKVERQLKAGKEVVFRAETAFAKLDAHGVEETAVQETACERSGSGLD